MPYLQPLPGSIAAIFADSAQSRTLTQDDRYGLLAAIITEAIDEEERLALDRILHSVRRGRLAIAA